MRRVSGAISPHCRHPNGGRHSCNWLRQAFPEINRGYIDLNDNGTFDETDDLNELMLTDARMQGDNAAIVGELRNIPASESETTTVRISAARTIRRIRRDIPILSVWQTLLELENLRWFSVKSLGELDVTDASVVETLTNVAVHDPDQALARQAVTVLDRLVATDACGDIPGISRRQRRRRTAVAAAIGAWRYGQPAGGGVSSGIDERSESR